MQKTLFHFTALYVGNLNVLDLKKKSLLKNKNTFLILRTNYKKLLKKRLKGKLKILIILFKNIQDGIFKYFFH